MSKIFNHKIKTVKQRKFAWANNFAKQNGCKAALHSGLTLVEVLASIAIFSVLSVAVITLFTNSVNAQYAILQNQQLLNESGYVMEYMHKTIRMAHRDDGTLSGSTLGGCTGITGYANTFGNNGSSTQLYFLGYDNLSSTYKCIRVYLDTDNKIKIKIPSVGNSTDLTAAGANAATAMELTSSQVKVNALNFYVSGESVGADQPKVTIVIDMQSNTKRINPTPRITLQTMASQRNLNVTP